MIGLTRDKERRSQPKKGEAGPPPEPDEEVVKIVLTNLTSIGMYVADLAAKTSKYHLTVAEIYACVSYLTVRGLVAGKGDGFGMLYFLTPEGLKRQSELS